MRESLPERRPQTVLEAEHRENGKVMMTLRVGFGTYPDGRIAEVFLDPDNSAWAPLMRDAGILLSLALQSGVTFEKIRNSLTRAEDGLTPLSAISTALDLIAKDLP